MRTHWSWQKVLFLAAALAAAGTGGFLAVRTGGVATGDERLPQPPTPSAPEATEEKAIRKNQSAYVKAFNAGDAKALAAFWAVDGEFMDAEGRSYRGRDTIEKEFAAYFAEVKGRTLEIHTESLRFVSPGIALESGSSRVAHGSDGPGTTAVYHIVHTKRDGRWLMASVRESPSAAGSNYEHLRDLEWLVGNWTAKRDAQTLEMSCEWTAGRNFLLRKYSLKGADGTRTGIQIVGWDAVLGTIRSWMFDSDGGFGSDLWTKDGPRWVMEATGVTRDGAQSTATNILTCVDHDNFNWQSAERELNEVRLPDTTLIKVTRVKAKK